jgi:hypothetical protein
MQFDVADVTKRDYELIAGPLSARKSHEADCIGFYVGVDRIDPGFRIRQG